MLVLTRKVGEEITIGDGVRVMVQRVSGPRVMLGIQAPAEVSIHRRELLEKAQAPQLHPGVDAA